MRGASFGGAGVCNPDVLDIQFTLATKHATSIPPLYCSQRCPLHCQPCSGSLHPPFAMLARQDAPAGFSVCVLHQELFLNQSQAASDSFSFTFLPNCCNHDCLPGAVLSCCCFSERAQRNGKQLPLNAFLANAAQIQCMTVRWCPCSKGIVSRRAACNISVVQLLGSMLHVVCFGGLLGSYRKQEA